MVAKRNNKNAERRLFLLSLLGAWLVVGIAATFQAVSVYQGQITPRFFVVPALVATSLGLLLGRMAVLRQRLREQSRLFRAIADLAHELTYYRRLDGSFDYVSPSSEQLLGFPPQAFYDDPGLLERQVHPEDRELWGEHQRSARGGDGAEAIDVRLLTRNGETVWVNHVCAPVYDRRGMQVGVRSTNLDITERREAQASAEHLAYYDPLTGLPNRRLIRQRIDELIATAGAGEPFAVMFLDLNRFKNINDSFGHAFGDRLLQKVAKRIERAAGEGVTVGRFGGDEFLLLVPGLGGEAQATALAEQILQAVERPLNLDWMELFVSGSIGITLYPEDGRDAEALIRNADIAMYKTKGEHGARIKLYSIHLSDEASHFVTTEHMIHQALRQRQFRVDYQPKVDMVDGSVIGLEALVRWQHPERGLLGPGEFIPVAEETGQIVELGWQVFQQVLVDLQRWQQEGCAVPVAINVSARQFADTGFCAKVAQAISESGCDPQLLGIEITEQVLLGDVTVAAERLQALRDTGMSLALDDFGIGYSSLNYLRQLPINVLKIDRSFVSGVADDLHNRAVLRAIISLCRDLKLDAVVEGVETVEQRDILLESGCRWAQGFYYHRPLPVEQVNALLCDSEATAS